MVRSAADKISMGTCANTGISGKTIAEHNLPDKTNIDILMAHPGAPAITAPDFYAASITQTLRSATTRCPRASRKFAPNGLPARQFTSAKTPLRTQFVDGIVFGESTNLNKSFPTSKRHHQPILEEGISSRNIRKAKLNGNTVSAYTRTNGHLLITKYEFIRNRSKFMDEYPVKRPAQRSSSSQRSNSPNTSIRTKWLQRCARTPLKRFVPSFRLPSEHRPSNFFGTHF